MPPGQCLPSPISFHGRRDILRAARTLAILVPYASVPGSGRAGNTGIVPSPPTGSTRTKYPAAAGDRRVIALDRVTALRSCRGWPDAESEEDMFVDVHTHTPRHRTAPAETGERAVDALWRPDGARSTVHTWDMHLEGMRPVDRAICFNIGADPRIPYADDGGLIYAAEQANDDTAAFVRAHPDKFIGFLTVHPHDPEVLDEIDRATGDLGLRGIKLGPNYQNFDPLGPEAFRVFKRAEELGLPVLLHQGT